MTYNKKGFTLIELLAVIVILAIILAVAVPSILGLIDNVNRNAFKSSVSMALEQGRLYQLNNTIGSGKTLTEIGLDTGSLNNDAIIKEDNLTLVTDTPAINNGKFCVIPGTTKNDLSNDAVANVKIQACKINPSEGEVGCGICKGDATAPIDVLLTIGIVTSNSIEVIGNGADTESGIASYEFSKDNGSTWTTAQTNNVYVFDNLSSGTYQFKIRVYNNVNMTTDSSMVSQTTTAVNTPTYSVAPTSGWAASKTVTIDYQTASYTKEYSIDGGSTWTTSITQTKEIVFNAAGSVIARVTDGVNTITSSTCNVAQIDTTVPIVATATIGTITSTSIMVSASGTDAESGIVNYAFSKDNGSTWTAMQASNAYIFTSLTGGATYQIKVRAYNGANLYLDSGSTIVTAFAFTGVLQTWTVPITATYTMEVWGAGVQSWGYGTSKGGKSTGTINLTSGQTIYLSVGQAGTRDGYNGSFGGGGKANAGTDVPDSYGCSGGGASDVRIGGTNLNNRIIVAGGSSLVVQGGGPDGGGINADPGSNHAGEPWYYPNEIQHSGGGSQTAGGTAYNTITLVTTVSQPIGNTTINAANGSLGTGGDGSFHPYGGTSYDYLFQGSGGGGGYYGGAGSRGGGYYPTFGTYYTVGSGGAGSSYISGHPGCIPATHSSGFTFSNTSIEKGVANPQGGFDGLIVITQVHP